MATPYSNDLRARAAAAVLDGMSVRDAAEVFDVSIACAARWSKRLRDSGSADARPMGGSRRAVLAGQRDRLLARIAETADLTLRGLRGSWPSVAWP